VALPTVALARPHQLQGGGGNSAPSDRARVVAQSIIRILSSARGETSRVTANLITIIKGLSMHQVGWLIKSKPYRRVLM
jgi:hypothetical protein